MPYHAEENSDFTPFSLYLFFYLLHHLVFSLFSLLSHHPIFSLLHAISPHPASSHLVPSHSTTPRPIPPHHALNHLPLLLLIVSQSSLRWTSFTWPHPSTNQIHSAQSSSFPSRRCFSLCVSPTALFCPLTPGPCLLLLLPPLLLLLLSVTAFLGLDVSQCPIHVAGPVP